MTEKPPMDEDELFETLGAADAMPIAAPPVAAIVERGRRDRRRVRTAALAGAAAAVVAVVGGVALATSGSGPAIAPAGQSGQSGQSDTAPDGGSAADAGAGPVPAAPDGMRWVGKAGVMVAVPAAWPVNALGSGPCGVPQEDTVLLDGSGRPCGAPRPPGVTTVELRTDRSQLPGAGEDLGDGVRRGQPECQESGGVCTTAVRVEDLGVSVYVDSEDPALVERISATVRRVPGGAAVVPARAGASRFIGDEGRAGYLRQLHRAGLDPELGAGLDPNGTFDIVPAPGSVVAEGSVVRLERPAT